MVISSDPLFQEEPYRTLTLLFYLINTLWNILCFSGMTRFLLRETKIKNSQFSKRKHGYLIYFWSDMHCEPDLTLWIYWNYVNSPFEACFQQFSNFQYLQNFRNIRFKYWVGSVWASPECWGGGEMVEPRRIHPRQYQWYFGTHVQNYLKHIFEIILIFIFGLPCDFFETLFLKQVFETILGHIFRILFF